MFKVVVPLKKKMKVNGRWISHVTYPASGTSLYTREQAIEVLRTFYQRSLSREGDDRECFISPNHWCEANSPGTVSETVGMAACSGVTFDTEAKR